MFIWSKIKKALSGCGGHCSYLHKLSNKTALIRGEAGMCFPDLGTNPCWLWGGDELSSVYLLQVLAFCHTFLLSELSV